ncbi:MAG: class I SAM-dependent methyltransferase [Gammaproteobacteria bacterium]|jgi:SAM-dependent methyltransferase
MGFAGDHFSKQASDYSLYRPLYPQSLFAYLATLTPHHDRAWDCATGNGQAAIALASFYNSVEATDASEKQIKQTSPHEKIHYLVCEASNTPFTENHFDLITVAQALHWFDLDSFYKEVKRVSKPGGIFSAWCYGLFNIDAGIDECIHYFYSETVGPFWPEERRYIHDGYTTLTFPFERIQPPQFAMSVRWDLRQVIGYLGTWSAVQYYRERHGQDPVVQIASELESMWGDSQEKRTINWPIYLHVGKIK